MADRYPVGVLKDELGNPVGLREFPDGDTLPKSILPELDAADVGLGNADNTSDADKPVSTAQQAALDLKLDANNWYLGTDKQHTADATGAVTLDLATASIFDLTLTDNVTLTVSNANVPAGETRSVVVRIGQGATARTLTWWSGITWLASTTPEAPEENKIKEYVLSYDGSSWLGREGASN